MDDEYLDLVDEKDNVIGKMKRAEVYAKKLQNFRVINVFLINSKGEIWIPRRTANKSIFPLCLDMSAAGHVESGETYEETLRREVREELNIEIDKISVKFLGYVTPKDGVNAYEKVYEIEMNEAPNYNKEDFIEYFWLKPIDVIKKIDGGDKAKGDLRKLIEIFYIND